MSNNSKLKELAEAVNKTYAGLCQSGGDDMAEAWHKAEAEFADAATPDVVLALISESETRRVLIKEMDLMFGRYILAMRSALIEEEHGNGPVAAMEWIYNSLVGPGQLPPEGETDAQAYFDREIVAVNNGMEEVLKFHEAQRAAEKVTP